ncbi:hypothetical protein SAMN05216456_3226 [Devosia crocina]|uniref:Uncharacterized protein n=1 Tax=Devosia crocina TaxID=429728 RepID=A0A1I7NTT5_9HYPH|nr:hypothetical protein [Devosia crocina]SFV38032.1 hypothetical protein SAMN05216456_3226 [Devosia crocina]
MTSYVRVSAEQIPSGATALLLFVHQDRLCAGVMKRRCDGRLERLVPDDPRPEDLVLGICRLMADMGPEDDLLVVLEPMAYWPEAFPRLRGPGRSKPPPRIGDTWSPTDANSAER